MIELKQLVPTVKWTIFKKLKPVNQINVYVCVFLSFIIKLTFKLLSIKTAVNCTIHISKYFGLFQLPAPEEVVLVLSPDNWPWYLNLILKKPIDLNISWHIHSSVPNDKVAKIKNYVKNLRETKSNSTINLRLIFKCGKFLIYIY